MKLSIKQLVMLTIGAGVWAACQTAVAQQKEEDSAYRWGRWAVLSPAAGGAEPFVAADTPGSQYNPRPDDPGYGRTPTLSQTPPVVVPNPPGNPPPVGDPRGLPPPVVVPNPPGNTPPIGDPRG